MKNPKWIKDLKCQDAVDQDELDKYVKMYQLIKTDIKRLCKELAYDTDEPKLYSTSYRSLLRSFESASMTESTEAAKLMLAVGDPDLLRAIQKKFATIESERDLAKRTEAEEPNQRPTSRLEVSGNVVHTVFAEANSNMHNKQLNTNGNNIRHCVSSRKRKRHHPLKENLPSHQMASLDDIRLLNMTNNLTNNTLCAGDDILKSKHNTEPFSLGEYFINMVASKDQDQIQASDSAVNKISDLFLPTNGETCNETHEATESQEKSASASLCRNVRRKIDFSSPGENLDNSFVTLGAQTYNTECLSASVPSEPMSNCSASRLECDKTSHAEPYLGDYSLANITSCKPCLGPETCIKDASGRVTALTESTLPRVTSSPLAAIGNCLERNTGDKASDPKRSSVSVTVSTQPMSPSITSSHMKNSEEQGENMIELDDEMVEEIMKILADTDLFGVDENAFFQSSLKSDKDLAKDGQMINQRDDDEITKSDLSQTDTNSITQPVTQTPKSEVAISNDIEKLCPRPAVDQISTESVGQNEMHAIGNQLNNFGAIRLNDGRVFFTVPRPDQFQSPHNYQVAPILTQLSLLNNSPTLLQNIHSPVFRSLSCPTSTSPKKSYKEPPKALTLPKEIYDEFEIVRHHRRSSFGRSLVEVRPRSLPLSPTLIATQDKHGQFSVPMDIESNRRGVMTINAMREQKMGS